MQTQRNMKYSENGLWIQKEGNIYRLGLSEKGQDDLGEVMFAEFPDNTTELKVNETIIGVEGAKAVSELTSPIAGKVVRWNAELEDNPEKLNTLDKAENWIVDLQEVDEEAFNNLSNELPTF